MKFRVDGVGARRATPPGPGPTLWGLARRGGRDASHPAFVTRRVTTWKHAPFSRAPRVCLRLGVVQNQCFSGPHGRQLASSWAGSQKNPEKTVKNVLKNGAKWRFFGGLERHFAVPAADGARSQPAILQNLTSVASGCIEQAAAPEIGGRAPSFTCVGQALGERSPRGTVHARLLDFAEGDAHAVRAKLGGEAAQLVSRPSAAARATSRGVLPSPGCATPLVKSRERAPEFAVT